MPWRTLKALKGDLQHVGFVLGGRPGARLAEQMQMPASRSTLLRLVAAAPLPEPKSSTEQPSVMRSRATHTPAGTS